mgnify:CR=1 FL=1
MVGQVAECTMPVAISKASVPPTRHAVHKKIFYLYDSNGVSTHDKDRLIKEEEEWP